MEKKVKGYKDRIRHTFTKPGVYTVTLTIWLNGIETQVVKPDLIVVHQYPKAFFTYAVSDTFLTAPLQLDFINHSTPGDGDTLTYSWSINYSDMPLGHETNFSYSFNVPGTYLVELIAEDENGCRSWHGEDIIVKEPIQIHEFEYITSLCDSQDSCKAGVNYIIENDTLKLFGQIERNCCAYNTAVIIDQGDTIRIPTFNSGAMCTCTCLFCFEIKIPEFTRDSCIILFDNQIFMINRNITSVSNPIQEVEISIRPNPFTESVIIETCNMMDENYRIEIFDVKGQLIRNQSISSEITTINTSNLSKGIYLLKVLNRDKVLKTERLLKE
jgi:PKD repeat protein